MKKIALAVSALSILLIGCTKEQSTVNSEENAPRVEEGKVFSFDATIEEAEDPDATRASIDASSGAFSWTNGDNIAVQLTDDTFKTFTYDSSKGKFLATLGDGESILDGGVAYYPATIAINGTPESVRFVAGIQSGNPSGFPMRATVSLASHTLSFTHLGGFLRLTLSRIPKDAATLQFEASGVTLSGDFAVSNDQISAASGTKTTLSCSVSESATSKVYTLIVPETSFASGFSVKILNGSSEELYTKSTSKPISVGRAKIKPMAALTVPVSLYINTCAAWWDDTQQYVYVADDKTSFVGWPGTAFNVDDEYKTFTHSSSKYNRVIEDLGSMTGKTAVIIINRNYSNGEDGPYGDLYRATLANVDLSSDVYVSLSKSTSTTHKVYVSKYSGDYYNVWAWYPNSGDENVFDGDYPGPAISSLSLGTLGDHDYNYFEIREENVTLIAEAGYGQGWNYRAQTTVSVANGWDYFVVLKNQDGAWSSASYIGYPALTISQN